MCVRRPDAARVAPSAVPLGRVVASAATVAPAPLRDSGLSARETDVVRLVATGRTNAEIAAELSISVGTVKTRLGNIQTGLPARNRVEIAAWASWRSEGSAGEGRTPAGAEPDTGWTRRR
ncbi:response regulator transcription factor [Streptomyces sp. MNU76]|uniref:response regulator transcription factor n=1 Tax=Streptomyces sp. MNU76 TaxID=2560026 RepID=UPI0035A856A1